MDGEATLTTSALAFTSEWKFTL